MPLNASIPTALLLFLAIPALADPVADIVILGEVHDNPDAHLGQAAALSDLQPTAVVFEMLTAEEARVADANRDAIADAWEASGWSDFGWALSSFSSATSKAASSRGSLRWCWATAPSAVWRSGGR